MSPFEAFTDAGSYYATLAHESTHWTKHPSRLAREFGGKTWDDEGYAEEELVTELGAAFLCANLELSFTPREDHASYIAHRLTVLKNDTRAIFRAVAHAQRAADFLHGLQPPRAARESAWHNGHRRPALNMVPDRPRAYRCRGRPWSGMTL